MINEEYEDLFLEIREMLTGGQWNNNESVAPLIGGSLWMRGRLMDRNLNGVSYTHIAGKIAEWTEFWETTAVPINHTDYMVVFRNDGWSDGPSFIRAVEEWGKDFYEKEMNRL